MQLSKQSSQRKTRYYLALVVVGGLFATAMFFLILSYTKQRENVTVHQKIQEQQEKINTYRAQVGLDHLLILEKMQNTRTKLPWSQYINKILSILEKIKAVDDGSSGNIFLSDFRVDLEKMSLNGFVSSLNILYYTSDKPNGYVSLFDRLEQLEFLEEIEAKHYNLTEEDQHKGYKFTLHSNIKKDVNNQK